MGAPVHGRPIAHGRGTCANSQAKLAVHVGSAAQVSLDLSNASVAAGGSVTVSGTVTDGQGNSLQGATVDLHATAGSLGATTLQSGPGGTYTTTLVAPQGSGPVTVTATLPETSAVAYAGVLVTDGTPTGGTLQASPSTIPLGGPSQISGLVTDAGGRALSGVTVQLTASAGTVPASATTGFDGVFTVALHGRVHPRVRDGDSHGGRRLRAHRAHGGGRCPGPGGPGDGSGVPPGGRGGDRDRPCL